MAHISEYKNGWRVQVEKLGIRKSGTFRTKAEAKNWASQTEADILSRKYGNYARHTFSDAIDKYLKEVSPKKKSQAKEILRLNAFKRDYPFIAKKLLTEVSVLDMSSWRNKRLNEVSTATVLREWNILSNVFTIARREWGWCGDSPMSMIERPNNPAPRDRRISVYEVKKICRQLGYVTGRIETKSQEAALAFLIGLRTAMRAGEILSLNDSRVNLKDRVLTVPHKTQHITGKERQIPITSKAAKLIIQLKSHGYFTIGSESLSALFRRACIAQNIKDLHFHDSRAEALTRLARKVDVMTLAKISGHKDLKILFNTYYRETAEDIAKRL